MTRCLMIQGSGSDAGKSLICAGLIRALANDGIKALPFKPQNMSNNAAVARGGEIGRAQALQAQAARVEPSVDMNPILLKPQGNSETQIIVQGRYWDSASARDYYKLKDKLMPFVEQSFRRICDSADVVIVEGAGSPSEVNLRQGDLANMGFASHFKIPIILVGDVERGGVIANLVGTHQLLPPEERDLIKGFIINKFRGDISLFDDAKQQIAETTGWACLGVLPWFEEARLLPQEDALGMDIIKRQQAEKHDDSEAIRIGVLRLPHIANFDDLDALRAEQNLRLSVIESGDVVPADLHLLIIPGSKATIADYRHLCEQGWDVDIKAHVRRGGAVMGLCGGYQMLGRSIEDREGLEGKKETVQALGLLDVETILGGDKHLSQTKARESLFGGELQGYEIHLGETVPSKAAEVFLHSDDGRVLGCMDSEKRVIGCYLHGLFGNDKFRGDFLRRFGDFQSSYDSLEARTEQTLDKLASHIFSFVSQRELLDMSAALQ